MLTTAISVALGFILLMLFYSLLASGMMELIASFFALRGKFLMRVLKGLLSPDDRKQQVFDGFVENPLFRQLSGYYFGKKRPPSYLGASNFSEILIQVINKKKEGASFREKLEKLPDPALKELLLHFLEDQESHPNAFLQKIEEWYDQVWERASGVYTRNVKAFLIVLGLGIAVLFNVDAVSLYGHLAEAARSDPESLANLAAAVSRQDWAVLPPDSTTQQIDTARIALNQQFTQYMQTHLQALNLDPLGIGWDVGISVEGNLFYSWMLKIFGWLITAICISMGAPFWFDLLKKIVQFRGTGEKPEESKPMPPAFIPPTGTVEVVEKPVG